MEASHTSPIRDSRSRRKLLEYLDFRYHAFKMKGRDVYGPLNTEAKEFRLLELYPGRRSERIRCFLRTASLLSSRCPPYETISYAWGDPTDRGEIEINGALCPVPRSSMLAVARMRYPSRSRTLWIDAVCIDQNNLDERAEQVILMRDIYSKSSRNLVYLGEDDESTASAVKSIITILGEIQQEIPDLSDFLTTIIDPVTFVEQRSTTGFEADLDFESLETFYSRPYFRRLWVTQETLLAPSNLCHCGPHEINLFDIFRASVWLRRKGSFVPASVDRGIDERILRWWNFLERKSTLTTTKVFADVLDLLYFAQGRETSDERDRVFALVGLLQGDVPSSIQPDYRVSAQDILREATRHSFVNGGYFDCWILGGLHHEETCELESRSWPSWVKDWSEWTFSTSSLSQHFRAHGSQSKAYMPSTEEEFAFWRPKDRDELILKGFVFDTVDRHSSFLQCGRSVKIEVLRKWIKEVENLIGISLDGAVTGEVYTLLDVLIAGNSGKVGMEVATEEEVLEGQTLSRFLRHRGIPVASLLQSSNYEEAAVRRYYVRMIECCTGRLVFCTSSGRIGLGPRMTRASDVVAVLRGCRWPVILRPVEEDVYRFAGICYVHGIMFGEAVEIHEAAGGTDTTIRIR